jgi:hypothetical protein
MHAQRPWIQICTTLLFCAALLGAGRAAAQTFYVATNGVDSTANNGSIGQPWATITYALDHVSDGALILVRPGLYTGRIRIRGNFVNGVTVRSEIPYQAQLRHNATVLTVFNDSADIQGISIEGFDVAHSGAGAGGLVVQIQDGNGTETSRITLRDNILHDSWNNDILKINNGASDIVVEGNIFYNQTGSDEHIDANSVDNVRIEGNLFFNDFAASARPVPTDTASFIVVKDSNGGDDEYLGSRNVSIRRNLFFHWEGSTGSNFVLLGEDGTANFEADGVLIENNLMLGDSANVMRAAFGCKGVRNVVFRANTVSGDLPSLAFAMRLNTEGANQANQNIQFYNNIWSDPSGTMEDFSDTPPGQTSSFTLSNNLYWNAGLAIPEDLGELVNPSDDAMAIVADPQLPSLAGLIRPVWTPGVGQFAGNYPRIADAFIGLATLYAPIGPGSAAIDRARADQMPADDILGRPRGSAADVGAWERSASGLVFADGFE